MAEQSEKEIIVVKYGSKAVTDAEGLNRMRIRHHVSELAGIKGCHDIVVVSSGAIAAGEAIIPKKIKRHMDMENHLDVQSLATVGSTKVFKGWQNAFARRDIVTGTVQVTNHEIEDASEGRVLERVLRNNIRLGIVPIINGNDAMSEEGSEDYEVARDNDQLALHVSQLLGASHLCLMTEVRGLIDPVSGDVVPTVAAENIGWALSIAGENGNGTRGGMKSKVEAAFEAAHGSSATSAHIAHAMESSLEEVIAGQQGTYFPIR